MAKSRIGLLGTSGKPVMPELHRSAELACLARVWLFRLYLGPVVSAITSPQQLVGLYPQRKRKLLDVVEADIPGTALGVSHEGPMKSCLQGQRFL